MQLMLQLEVFCTVLVFIVVLNVVVRELGIVFLVAEAGLKAEIVGLVVSSVMAEVLPPVSEFPEVSNIEVDALSVQVSPFPAGVV